MAYAPRLQECLSLLFANHFYTAYCGNQVDKNWGVTRLM